MICILHDLMYQIPRTYGSIVHIGPCRISIINTRTGIGSTSNGYPVSHFGDLNVAQIGDADAGGAEACQNGPIANHEGRPGLKRAYFSV